MSKYNKILVIGGGAAGFFAAINIRKNFPDFEVTILEQSNEVLSKVSISGGGRCNVTHACWEPKELVKFYPRGSKELLGPFHHFACGDTFAWFEGEGIPLKIEDDGRCFPESNSSQSVVHCFLSLAEKLNIKIIYSQKMRELIAPNTLSTQWQIVTNNAIHTADKIVLASGSSKSVWSILDKLGLNIIPPVPSLFTFNIKEKAMNDMMGISVSEAKISIPTAKLENRGSLLITHWGISGPAVLRLSSFGARWMHEQNYHFEIFIDWLPKASEDEIFKSIKFSGAKSVLTPQLGFPGRLWKYFVQKCKIPENLNCADLNKQQLQNLVQTLKKDPHQVSGKSTFKEEFVTAGGVDLKEIDFKNFSSKKYPTLFLAGEVLNIDALTGGFNFQAAWTGGYLIARGVGED
ncbi:MAG TPA: NAD(P)/FAD-dependent oxidoreductase [Saprospiraceae bacterium]|nr:NAD(P)/FAD-dependent oxidoreductase [Saprospiraceae bacterium]HPQ20819.1 NAD(P)/FAD-dependent oxidoreductase [Saprospiraceae bacterium]